MQFVFRPLHTEKINNNESGNKLICAIMFNSHTGPHMMINVIRQYWKI